MYSNIRLMPNSKVFYDYRKKQWNFELLADSENEPYIIKVFFSSLASFKLSIKRVRFSEGFYKQTGLKKLLLTHPCFLEIVEKINELETKMKSLISLTKVDLLHKEIHESNTEVYPVCFSMDKEKMKNLAYYIKHDLSFAEIEKEVSLSYYSSDEFEINLIKDFSNGTISFSAASKDECPFSFYPSFQDDLIEQLTQDTRLRVKLLTI